MTIENRIQILKKALSDSAISDESIVHRFIIYEGAPYVFEGAEEKYLTLKETIASHFAIHPDTIKMVGSAKMGFSISPKQTWRELNDDSDIDMVLISERIFDTFWKEIFRFNIDLVARTRLADKRYFKFLDYFFSGWLRPDLFPFNNSTKEKWFEYFRSISYGDYGYRKITCAIFRDMDFFQTYHAMNIRQLRAGR
jgi:hypothetical protein